MSPREFAFHVVKAAGDQHPGLVSWRRRHRRKRLADRAPTSMATSESSGIAICGVRCHNRLWAGCSKRGGDDQGSSEEGKYFNSFMLYVGEWEVYAKEIADARRQTCSRSRLAGSLREYPSTMRTAQTILSRPQRASERG
jgi:hypothetical protein